ncbi:MAG: hypothetical protein QM753_06705 [Thermomicrobiales bacterium]
MFGSDIPFFFGSPIAVASGTGTTIAPLPPLPATCFAVMASARIDLPRKTAVLYGAIRPEDFTDGARTEAIAAALRTGNAPDFDGDLLANPFRTAWTRLGDPIAPIEDAMRRAGAAWTALSGAGPTVYTLTRDSAHAGFIAARLHESLPQEVAVNVAPIPDAWHGSPGRRRYLSSGTTMNRRSAIVAGVLGATTGALWVGGFTWLIRRHDPTLEVIGRGDDLMALLDTGSFRALIVVGQGRPDRIGTLLGTFRRRVDMVIGSQVGIAALGDARIERLGITQALVLDVPSGVKSLPATEEPGPAVLHADLLNGMVLTIGTFPQGAWQQDREASQVWTVTIARGEHRCAIAPNLAVLSDHAESGVVVGIGAKGDLDHLWDMLRTPLIAVNANRYPKPDSTVQGMTSFRIFPNDPLTFTFSKDGIAVAE